MNDDNAGTPGRPGDGGPEDPLAKWFAQFGVPGGGEFDLEKLVSELQRAMSAMSGQAGPGAIDWSNTKQAARQVVASLGPDPSVTHDQQRRVAEADRLASLWLDSHVSFDALAAGPAAWSRAEWVENSMESWRNVAEPIVTRIADALAASFGQQFGSDTGAPDELGRFGAMLTPMLRGAAGSMYALQIAQAIGKVATQVVTGTEIGFQLLKNPQVVLLPTNVEQFASGLGISDDDVRIYLCVREGARQRLFAEVGWLGPQLLAYLEHYAREITIDVGAISETMGLTDMSSLTPERMSEISQQLQGRLFAPTRTPEQVEILGRLETLLALVEGWVDEVTTNTVAAWMPHAANSLTEAVRRRRATGGPTQQVFSALVGLDLSPRRIRDAANLWAALTRDRGATERDAVWAHPDMMPTAENLADPLAMVADGSAEQQSAQMDEMDVALAELLEQAEQERRDEPESGDPGSARDDGGDGPRPTPA